jgi:hypothetical protein
LICTEDFGQPLFGSLGSVLGSTRPIDNKAFSRTHSGLQR